MVLDPVVVALPGFFPVYDYGPLVHYGYLSLSYIEGF
jgi:hypothetical protein